jgi:hypothetical protein
VLLVFIIDPSENPLRLDIQERKGTSNVFIVLEVRLSSFCRQPSDEAMVELLSIPIKWNRKVEEEF